MKLFNIFRFASAFASVLVALTWPASGFAQGFALNRFDPAEHGSNWFSGESLDLRGHFRPSLGLTLDYAHKPLVAYDANGDEIGAVIDNQLYAHVGGALILWDRLRLAVNVPIAVLSQGDSVALNGVTFTARDGASLGDVRLGLDVRLLGEHGDVATLALGAQVHLPTGDDAAYTGDGGVRITPRLMLAGDIGIFAYSARVGVAVRTRDGGGGVSTGSELAFVGTAGVRVLDRKLLLGPELWGSTVISDGDAFFAKESTPFEVVFGGHYTAGDFIFALGVGPGLTRGLGAPAVRVLGSIEWLPAIEEEAPPEPPSDRDRDGIPDDEDACPDEKGVRSSDPERNGCPPPRDRDRDGIPDDEDACPDEKGIETDDPETHGCPPDRDGDGIYDDDDDCPDVKGVASDEPGKNGCPSDRDGDRIVDDEDACPDAAGPSNEDPRKHGCPAARVEKGQIKIIERIEFKTNSDKILPESFSIMEAVAEVLRDNPDITRLSIEGHTDDVGKAAYNKKLSQRRADAVMRWLVNNGIDRKRLEAHGYGMERPIADNDSEDGRQTNRRVEFHIRAQDGASDDGVEEE